MRLIGHGVIEFVPFQFLCPLVISFLLIVNDLDLPFVVFHELWPTHPDTTMSCVNKEYFDKPPRKRIDELNNAVMLRVIALPYENFFVLR